MVARVVNGVVIGAGVAGALVLNPRVEAALRLDNAYIAAAVNAGLGIVAGMIPLPGGVQSVGAGYVAGSFGRAVTLILAEMRILTR